MNEAVSGEVLSATTTAFARASLMTATSETILTDLSSHKSRDPFALLKYVAAMAATIAIGKVVMNNDGTEVKVPWW